MRFKQLIAAIADTHQFFQTKAVLAVNQALTIRNWLIGFYIAEFEQSGADRAQYGKRLMEKIAADTQHIKGMSLRNLKLFRQFYFAYPEIGQSLTVQFQPIDPIGKFPHFLSDSLIVKGQLLTALLKKTKKVKEISINSGELIEKVSFTHLIELSKIDDRLKRAFYEIECIKGNWSVRELKRQITSLYFERSGLSKDKTKLSEYTQNKAVILSPGDVVQDPFFFEFLGLKQSEVVKESDLEKALLDNLQAFILELGHGFCFEARQKRITIGGEYFFVDLVFYHRILKCHILIELKLQEFNHANLGQLNTYLNYYKKHETQGNDNPPVGILLCTDKNHSLVEYATAGMDNNLFVSKYMVVLPSKEELQQFIKNEISKRGIDESAIL